MRHAILLISSKGLDYMISNIMQYKNYQSDFDIYIHVDKDTYYDLVNRYQNNYEFEFIKYLSNEHNITNIKHINHKYVASRFSWELYKVTEYLLTVAYNSSIHYSHYHTMSDNCFFYMPINICLEYFDDHKNYDFMEYRMNNHFKILGQIGYKGSQWNTWSYDTVQKTFDANVFKTMNTIYEHRDMSNPVGHGAYDECVLQTGIVKYVYKSKIFTPEYKSKTIRYISWTNEENPGSPIVINEKYINNIFVQRNRKYTLYNYFILRKIDVKNQSSINALNRLQKEFENISSKSLCNSKM